MRSASSRKMRTASRRFEVAFASVWPQDDRSSSRVYAMKVRPSLKIWVVNWISIPFTIALPEATGRITPPVDAKAGTALPLGLRQLCLRESRPCPQLLDLARCRIVGPSFLKRGDPLGLSLVAFPVQDRQAIGCRCFNSLQVHSPRRPILSSVWVAGSGYRHPAVSRRSAGPPVVALAAGHRLSNVRLC